MTGVALTEAEAFNVLGQITVHTNGWDTPRVNAWIGEIVKMTSLESALHAAKVTIDSWMEVSAPPWALFRDAYLRHLSANRVEPRAIEAGLDEYGFSRTRVPPPDEGVGIAKSAYMDAGYSNVEWFEDCINPLAREARRAHELSRSKR